MSYPKIISALNRRDFMKACAVAGVGIGMGKTSPLIGGTLDRKIRIGIIGLSVHSANFTDIINRDSAVWKKPWKYMPLWKLPMKANGRD